MQAHEIPGLDPQPRDAEGHGYVDFLASNKLSVGLAIWPAGSVDRQRPHEEDEVYYVITRRGTIWVADEDALSGQEALSSSRLKSSTAFTTSKRTYACWFSGRRRTWPHPASTAGSPSSRSRSIRSRSSSLPLSPSPCCAGALPSCRSTPACRGPWPSPCRRPCGGANCLAGGRRNTQVRPRSPSRRQTTLQRSSTTAAEASSRRRASAGREAGLPSAAGRSTGPESSTVRS